MKRALFLNLNDAGNYPFCKDLERRGFQIFNLFRQEPGTFVIPNRIKVMEYQKDQDICLEKFNMEQRYKDYFDAQNIINISNLNLNDEDKIFCFNEELLFESACLGNTFITARDAFSLSSKHVYYRKLGIGYKKIYSQKQFLDLNEPFIIKPSVASCGKRHVFDVNSHIEKLNILKKHPQIFDGRRLFIAMPKIKISTEIWVFTLFDNEMKPHLLWFVTADGSSTKSPFEDDLYKKILEINNRLKIRKWMAFMQFILDQDGQLHFIDLNPRIPGNDNWYELVYKYLTGERLSKIVLDLILDNKAPPMIRTNKYVLDKEFEEGFQNIKNSKIWLLGDSYKDRPVSFFKKYL